MRVTSLYIDLKRPKYMYKTQMRSALYWDFTQPRTVVPSRNIGKELTLYAARNTKKSTDITHIVVQARNLVGIT